MVDSTTQGSQSWMQSDCHSIRWSGLQAVDSTVGDRQHHGRWKLISSHADCRRWSDIHHIGSNVVDAFPFINGKASFVRKKTLLSNYNSLSSLLPAVTQSDGHQGLPAVDSTVGGRQTYHTGHVSRCQTLSCQTRRTSPCQASNCR